MKTQRTVFFLVLVLMVTLCVFAGGKEAAAETAGPKAAEFHRPHPFHMTDAVVTSFSEAPMLAKEVAAGKLPPVEARLPENPIVVAVLENIGRYGGNVRSWWGALAAYWIWSTELAHSDLVRQIFGNSAEYEPDLAERWEISGDNKVFTFHLRKGLKWSDGHPFTTEDIMFWYEDVLQNPSLTPVIPALWMVGDKLTKIEAVDEMTLRFSFVKPNPLFLLNLTAGVNEGQLWINWVNHPKHYMVQFHEAYATKAELSAKLKEAGLDSWIDLYRREAHPHTASADRPYTWPWTPDPATADGRWSWTRNPYYYKVDEEGNQLPYIDTWNFEMVPDKEVAVLNLIAGEYDFVSVILRGDRLATLKEAIKRGSPFKLIPNPNAKAGEVSLYINETTDDPELRKIFQDVRFREAVSIGVNREEVSAARFDGFSEVGQGSFPPVDPYVYDREWHKSFTQYDPERAEQLLDEVGLAQRDRDGFRLRPAGRRFTVLMDIHVGNHVPAIDVLVENMKKIGIDVQVRPSSRALYYERTSINSVQWMGWSCAPSYFQPTMLLPEMPFRAWGVEWIRWNQTKGQEGEEPPEDVRRLFELVVQSMEAESIEHRAELLREAGKLHQKNIWVIGLAGMDERPSAVNPKMRNIPFDPAAPIGLNHQNASAHAEYTEQWYFEE